MEKGEKKSSGRKRNTIEWTTAVTIQSCNGQSLWQMAAEPRD